MSKANKVASNRAASRATARPTPLELPEGVPEPPASLEADGRALWIHVCTDFDLEARHLVVLARACAALDRAARAGRLIAVEGEVVRDRFGQPRVHPACAVERDADASFRHALHELGLDVVASSTARRW